MDEDPSLLSDSPATRNWQLPLLVVFVVILGYGIGPTRLPLNGEETRRARFGVEMVESGDWVVATNQFEPMLDRPPMQYWTLAVIHKWIHKLDPLTLRLSMTVTTLITALMIWWYTRRFLDEAGAFLAAVAYPTMGHVFDLGRRVETDGLFTLLLAGSLMVWHYGYTQRWRPVWIWSAGGLLAALATLTKGTQGPVAFFGTVYLFLLIRRDWRSLFHWSHFVGLAVFAAAIAIWQVPFFLREGWESTRMTWFDPFADRGPINVVGVVVHFLKFPFVVLGASMPWSALLLGLLHPAFWKSEERSRSAVSFILIGMASIFVPVWISRWGHQRYVMAMYPLMAVICGTVLQQALSLDMQCSLRKLWCRYARITAVVVAGLVGVFGVTTIVAALSDAEWAKRLAQPWWLMGAMAAGTAVGVVVVFRSSVSDRQDHAVAATVMLASLLAVSFNGAIVNAQAHTMVSIGPQVVAVRDRLPEQRQLVSFGLLHHRFLYYFEERIPVLPWPKTADDVADGLEYFAVNVKRGESIDLPFAWEQVVALNMDRRQSDNPENRIVIGRRIKVPQQLQVEPVRSDIDFIRFRQDFGKQLTQPEIHHQLFDRLPLALC